MNQRITPYQVFHHSIYGEIESLSNAAKKITSTTMASIANLFVEHGFLRPVPKWVEVTEDTESLPEIGKIVILKLKSGQEILGGYGCWEALIPVWCVAVDVYWDSKSKTLKCDDLEPDDLQVTHWREV